MPYTGYTEPAPLCTHCHIRPARPHMDTCTDADCQQIALMHTARDLMRAALTHSEQHSDDGDSDPVIALVWITRTWRAQPTLDELTLQRLVVQMLEQSCTAAELATWRELDSEAVANTVDAMVSKHTAARRVVDTIRDARAA